MIYTVTLNPALDKTVEIPSFTTDGVKTALLPSAPIRAVKASMSQGGCALGSTSRALGILGRQHRADDLRSSVRPEHDL